jgi:hypothetical protein
MNSVNKFLKNFSDDKFKWFLKKIILLFKHPIILLTSKFDFSFVFTIYKNNQTIQQNFLKYNNLDVSEVGKLSFENITNKSTKASHHLSVSINSEYFDNIVKYGYGYKILKFKKFDLNYLLNFHLYPANIFVLNEIIKLVNDNFSNKTVIVVDYPSGIGNLALYLSHVIQNFTFVGIDNYEQISKDDIAKYQNLTGLAVDTYTYEEFDSLKNYNKVDILVSIELNLQNIIENILSIGSKFLIIETMYVSRYKNIQQKIEKIYELYIINEMIIVYKRKNIE